MSFNRNKVQLWWEAKLGCTDVEKWTSYKNDLLLAQLGPLDEPLLLAAVQEDLTSYGQKALLSFLQALESIKNRHYAWAIVKLYYCIFYCLRFEILHSGHILVRCKALYIMRIAVNEKFAEVKSKKLNGDHKLTIKAESDLVAGGKINDPILDNQIDNKNPYFWLMEQRERIHYRQSLFPDPECDEVLTNPNRYIEDGKLKELLALYLNDTILAYAFDKDHSMLSIPFYRIMQVCRKMDWTKVGARHIVHMQTIARNLGLSKSDLLALTIQSSQH